MKSNPEFKLSTIREGRRTKEDARNKGVTIFGSGTAEYKEKVVPAVEKHIAEAVEKHRNWIEDELHTFPIEGSVIQPAEALAVFRGTLEKRIKQYARLNRTKPETLVTRGSLTPIFQQAAFDFIQSLRMSHQRGETVKQALALAGLSHWLDPRTPERLAEKYKNLADTNIINRAMLNSSANPDAFIDSHIDAVKRLTQEYGPTRDKDGYVIEKGKVDPSVIKRAARSKDPDAFIKKYLGEVARLTIEFGDRVNQDVIEPAALNYKNPDKFINRYIRAVKNLTQEYGPTRDKENNVIKEGKIDQSVINRAALLKPKKRDAFIKKYLRNVPRLTEKYGDRVGQNVIKTAAASYPKNPDAFIDSYLIAVPRLATKYGGRANPEIIHRAALHYSKNPDAFVDWFLDAEEYLLSILPETSDKSVVRKILLSNELRSKEKLSQLL